MGSEAIVIDRPDDLSGDLLGQVREMPDPRRVLMCPPTYFDVVDVKNPFMEGQIGRVDRAEARRQWEQVREAFSAAGVEVVEIEPVPGCEDMVFCANQTLPGLDARGRRVCVLSRMVHPSRQREVPAFQRWFREAGYDVVHLPEDAGHFEGCGDALWHPRRGLLWGGYGVRSEAGAYPFIAERFGVPVLRLRLASQRFYHLDTALCPIDAGTAMVYPGSLEPAGLALVRAVFQRVLEVDQEDAERWMACNATAVGGRVVIMQRGTRRAAAALREMGYEVVEVETGEFLKSGGSVFCMKMFVF